VIGHSFLYTIRERRIDAVVPAVIVYRKSKLKAASNFKFQTPLVRRPAIERDPEPVPYPSNFYRRISLLLVRHLEVSTSQEDGSRPLLLRSDATLMGKRLRFETMYWSRNVDTRLASNRQVTGSIPDDVIGIFQ
jgi:hypothetical protein